MKSFSEETRRKMSESAKRRCADPAWIEAQKNRGTKLDFNAVKTRDIHNAVTKEMVDVALLKRIHDLETEIKQIERIHDKGSCVWASEIEEFPIAVTKHHFPDEEAEAGGNGG